MDSPGSGQTPVAASCEYGGAIPGFIKGEVGNFLSR
jgi:hypothetical protein